MIGNLREFFCQNALRALLVVLVVTVGVCIYIAAALRFDGQNVHRHQWIAEFAQVKRLKYRELRKNEPLMVFSGDSTALYAIDANVLSHTLGRAVFNYGLGAANGLEFILKETEKTVLPGDVVILMVADKLLAETGRVYLNEALTAVLNHERLFAEPMTRQIEMLASIPWSILLFGFPQADSDSFFEKVYVTSGFDATGTVNAKHLAEHAPPFLPKQVLPAIPVSDYSLALLKRYLRKWRRQDIELVVMPSPRLETYSDRPAYQSTFTANQQRLRDAGIPVVSFPDGLRDVTYPLSSLYDLNKHLNPKGRKDFTQKVSDLDWSRVEDTLARQ